MNVVAATDERIRTLLPVHLLTAGADHKQDARRRPEGAGFYQFLYIAKGRGRFEVGGCAFTASEGETVFTAKGCPISYAPDGCEFRTGWIAFDGPQTEQILSYLSAGRWAVLRSETVSAEMADLQKRALRNASSEVLSQGVYRLIVTFFGELNEGRKPTALCRAKNFIEAHYNEDLSVSDIARASEISQSLLFRLFRSEEQTTPIDYLRGFRIKRAKELLIDSPKLRVAEIARLTGFSDTAYFCKVFHKETGITPGVYRKHFLL